MRLDATVSKNYRLNLMASAATQAFLLLLGGLMTDGGQFGQWVVYAIAIYWIMALLVILRRPHHPTKGDFIAIKYGFVFILVVLAVTSSFRWMMTGF